MVESSLENTSFLFVKKLNTEEKSLARYVHTGTRISFDGIGKIWVKSQKSPLSMLNDAMAEPAKANSCLYIINESRRG